MLSFDKARECYDRVCRAAVVKASEQANTILFITGLALFIGGMDSFASAQTAGTTLQACGRILAYIETGFGALIAAGAGIGAIIAAAVGGFKAAWGLLVVSVGSFILRAYLTLFHNPCTI